MKLIHEVKADKLRGGYYTADRLVDWCLDRVVRLTRPAASLRWLEPSAGDGAFVRGLARLRSRCDLQDARVTAIELIETEAAACRRELRASGLRGRIVNDSFFAWAQRRQPCFDALVGNPPYVRYQFVDPEDRRLAEELTKRMGIELRGVSNLWIPFALVSMALLRPGGAFALVLPTELFCTVSGGQFRSMVVGDFASLRVDLFPRDTFPDILQDVVVVSGVRAKREASRRPVIFCEYRRSGNVQWKHSVAASPESWQRYLLTAQEVSAFEEARRLRGMHRLGEVARIEVSIVTGANPFFTIDDATLSEIGLEPWARPLLARTADAPGIIFKRRDHTQARRRGRRVWLLDFSADRPAPNGQGRVGDYLAMGEEQGLHERYKCRIRSPWYRVPQIKSGRLMMTKRAHHYHRLLLNKAGVFTTDTVYRGEMHDLFSHREEDLVAGFQNTLTLLSSEIEGRTYGGGVLELVPSEIARLHTPLVSMAGSLSELDALSRSSAGQQDETESVVAMTDAAISGQVEGYAQLLPTLRAARSRLMRRRMDG